MVTYFIGRDEVSAYMRDFLTRLQRFNPVPTLWCPITRSGSELLNQLITLAEELFPQMIDSVSVLPIAIDEETDKIRFVGDSPSTDIAGRSVLLFDGAIHSGRIMTQAVTEVLRHGASDVCSFSLVVKRGSVFIPTLWSVMIDDTDRAFFLLNEIPNNRLDVGVHSSPTPKKIPLPVYIRLLSDDHLQKPPVISGVASLDRVTWDDRRFDMLAGDHRCTYVLQRRDDILGYITMHVVEPRCLVLDEVVVGKKHLGQNLGGVLMRFADSLARKFDCQLVRLHSIESKVEFYKHFGYRSVANNPIPLGQEKYWLMERPVLHNQSALR